MNPLTKLIRRIPFVSDATIKTYRTIRAIAGRRRLRKCADQLPIKLIVGASSAGSDGWVQTDVEYLNLLHPSDWESYFPNDSIEAIMAEHVWEHLTQEEGLKAARVCFRFLRPGGYLRVAVPDGHHPDPKYIDYVKVNGSGPGAYDHKMLYTCDTFKALFEQAGFDVTLLEYFDAEGQFHFSDWDALAGKIHRSKRFDSRNADGKLGYTSIILDAHKPSRFS